MFRLSKAVFIFCFGFLICNIPLYSQKATEESVVEDLTPKEHIVPMIKTPFPIRCATWNKDGKCFAYVEKQSIIVRNAQDFRVLNYMDTSEGNIAFLKFTQETFGEGLDQLATITENNTIAIRIMPQVDPISSVQGPENVKPTALALNTNGNYVATAYEDGTIEVYMQNYLTNTMIKRNFEGINGSINSINFSKDNKYLVTGANTDEVTVWNLTTGKLEYSFYYNSLVGAPVLLSEARNQIICTIGKKEIGIFDFDGFQTSTIKTKWNIVSMELTSSGEELVALMDNNRFYFYNLSDGECTGYIPAYNGSKVTSYAFNNEASSLLVGHYDGTLYILNLDDVVLDPAQKAPSFKVLIADDTSLINQIVDPNDIPGKVRSKTGHSIPMEVGISVLPAPFVLSLGAGVGYKNYSLIKPFYFGGMFIPLLGFPKQEFPYSYALGGYKLNAPLLVGAKYMVPFGFSTMPFKNNVYIFAEIDPGLAFHHIWNGKLGEESITSKIFPSFCTDIKVGAGWKFLNLSLGGSYDALLGFSFNANIGFTIDFNEDGSGSGVQLVEKLKELRKSTKRKKIQKKTQ